MVYVVEIEDKYHKNLTEDQVELYDEQAQHEDLENLMSEEEDVQQTTTD